MQSKLKLGLFAIGLKTYWNQFDGLKSRLEGYLGVVEGKIKALHPQVINAGLIDTVDKSFEAGSLFRRNEVDLVFLYISTYALSSTVLPAVQAAQAPVILLNLSPEKAIDYDTFNAMQDRTRMTGEWLAYCSACPVPELINVFKRIGIRYHQVTGLLEDDPLVWQEVSEWIDAAKVKNVMFYNRLGCIGNYYNGMLDIYTDLTRQYKYFGGHIELIEPDELTSIRNSVTQTEINRQELLFEKHFDIELDCSKSELTRAAKTSAALEKLVRKFKLGAIAYYCKGSDSNNEDTFASVILGNSLLTANNIPVAGEYDIKNAQAMKILDSFGIGGSFTEYYAMDYQDDVILMGHDGPGHILIADGKPKVKPLQVYHGKVGKGLSVEMVVKHGPVTMLSVIEQADGTLALLVAEGTSVAGKILKIGNTNSRYKFSIGAKSFLEAWNSYGPAHHCAVGIGHIADKLKKLGALLDMEVIIVCRSFIE